MEVGIAFDFLIIHFCIGKYLLVMLQRASSKNPKYDIVASDSKVVQPKLPSQKTSV